MHSSWEDVINIKISFRLGIGELVHRLLGKLSETAVSDFVTNSCG